MASPSGLEGRLLAVLDQRANRRCITRAWAFAALTLGLCLVIPVAMLRAASDKTLSDAVVHEQWDNQKSTIEDDLQFVEVTQNNSRAMGFDWYLGNVLMNNGVVATETGSLPPGASTAKPQPTESADAGDNEVNRVKLAHAESELQRATALRERNLISETDFNKARTETELARAELAGRRAEVAEIKLRNAEAELARLADLQKANLVSKDEVDQAKYRAALLRAEMSRELSQDKARGSGTATPSRGQILVEARLIEASAKERIPDDPSNIRTGKGITVLSSPRVLTFIGEEAEFFIGQELPLSASPGATNYFRTGTTMRIRPELNGDRIAYTARLTLCDLVHSEAKDTQTIHETSSRELRVSGTAKDGEGTWFRFSEYRNEKKGAVRAVWLRFKRQP